MKIPSYPAHWLVGLLIVLLLAATLLLPPRFLDSNEGLALSGSPAARLPCAVEEVEPNDGVGAASRTPPLCSQRPIPGTIPEGDSDDLYRLEVREAGMVQIVLSEILPQTDLDLYLYDATEQLLASSAGHGNLPERLQVEVAAGSYWLRVYPFSGHQSERYVVRWNMQPAAATPTLSLEEPIEEETPTLQAEEGNGRQRGRDRNQRRGGARPGRAGGG